MEEHMNHMRRQWMPYTLAPASPWALHGRDQHASLKHPRSGDIVGHYADTLTGSGPHRGFVPSRKGVFTTIDYGAPRRRSRRGMNSRGDIPGTYTLADNANHKLVMSANQFSTIGQFTAIFDVPGETATVVIAINGDEIVGGYTGAVK
jgi:hypothetical protein